MDKNEIEKDVFSDLVFDYINNLGKSTFKELITEFGLSTGKQIVVEAAVETASNTIPIIGNAIQKYKIKQRFIKIEKFIQILEKRIDKFTFYNEKLDGFNKDKFNDLLIYAIDSVGEYSQEEKIEYLVNGLETIIQAQDISSDIGYLYINTLNRLRLLDIAVLKTYNKNNIYREEVLSDFKIEHFQFEAVQDNLYTIGLLQRKNERNIGKDFKNIQENLKRLDMNIEQLYKYLEKAIGDGKLGKNNWQRFKEGKVRFETNDHYEISQFGVEFYRYFITEGNK